MEYLSLYEILSIKVDVNGELTLLLSNKILIYRPNSLLQNKNLQNYKTVSRNINSKPKSL